MPANLGPFKYPIPNFTAGEVLITGLNASLSVASDPFPDYYAGSIIRLIVQQGDTRQEATTGFNGNITALTDEGNSPQGKMAFPTLAGEGSQDFWEIDFSATYGTGSIYYTVEVGGWFYSVNVNKTVLQVYGPGTTYWEDLGLVAGAECYYLLPP